MEFLGLSPAVVLGIKMVAGFLASVGGIALWAHTREPSWILIILATLVGYIGVIFEFLDLIGIFSLDVWMPGGVSLLRVLFAAVVPVLYAIGFILAVRSFVKP